MKPLDALFEFLSIPSVSTDPARKEDVRRAALWLGGRLEALGFQVEVAETPGHPIVFAEKRVSDRAPTLLIYGHYDVQPPEPLELWETPPFVPTLKDGRIYARGASDDKGQLYAHVAAVEALGEALPVNVKFLVEGEEEIGSPHLPAYVWENRDRLRADAVLVSDGAMFAPHTPTLTYGLRGLVYLEVLLEGAARDLHSGVYGGAAPNPLQALAWMAARLKGEDHRVRIPGFYDRVRPVSQEEKALWPQVDEEAFKASVGLEALWGEEEYSLLERLWTRPTLDLNGAYGGFQGEGSKTVIPARAGFKFSMRLVPDQDPEEVAARAEDYLRSIAPLGIRVRVLRHGLGRPVLTDPQSLPMRLAAEALEEVWGRKPVYTREGGSIPIVAELVEALKAPVVLMGFGLNDDNLHAPNEKLDLVNFEKGIAASQAFLRRLSRLA
ncbi:dipeptidase [Thermus filiformis]|uniref:Peptidase M20 n=1 Tax=Thermus filiformis TaxID=276 RepID=A0A0A2WXB8_THEFI|nr:dipeptidase [Thermus filiformis]KGQ22945.1 peptidase M20 [Thermus filiformis]